MTNVFQLKVKCNEVAKHTQVNLRTVSDDKTRDEPGTADISFIECELTMYPTTRTLGPKIPLTAINFCGMLTTSAFAEYYKISVTIGNQTADILQMR